MIYYAKTANTELKLEVVTSAEGQTTLKLPDGQELKADFDPVLGQNFFSLLLDNQSHEVYVKRGENSEYIITLNGYIYTVEVESERQHRFASLTHSGRADTGEVNVKAPMPGLVTIVGVQPGDEVEQGQRLLVLEAMKMENELRAPRAGKVKAVNVQKGQTVEQNKVLLVIE